MKNLLVYAYMGSLFFFVFGCFIVMGEALDYAQRRTANSPIEEPCRVASAVCWLLSLGCAAGGGVAQFVICHL